MERIETLSFAGKWMELENIISSKLARLRRPKHACSPSYVKCRLNTNAAILRNTGHIKGGHTQEG
jgi:hypothetical protein